MDALCNLTFLSSSSSLRALFTPPHLHGLTVRIFFAGPLSTLYMRTLFANYLLQPYKGPGKLCFSGGGGVRAKHTPSMSSLQKARTTPPAPSSHAALSKITFTKILCQANPVMSWSQTNKNAHEP